MTLRVSGGRFGFFLVDLASSDHADTPASGLFMQFRIDNEEYVVLADPEADPTHDDVVEHFCARMRLPFETIYGDGPCSCGIGEPGWVIVGGGGWHRSPEGEWIELSGSASRYGRFDPEGLEENLRAIPGWARVEVRVG